MTCPYCGREMAEGYVTAGTQNRDGTYWRPRTEGVRDWLTRHYQESVCIVKGMYHKTGAWYCYGCQKIIVDLSSRGEAN